MNRTRFGYVVLLSAASYLFAANSSAWAETLSEKSLLLGQGLTQGPSEQYRFIPVPDMVPPDPRYGKPAPDEESTKTKNAKSSPKAQEIAKTPKETAKAPEVFKETPIENVIAVTTEQLTNKPQEYLNKNVKFTAPFFAFSNLALDYKPAFRSSRTYLSFLVLRPNTHTPFSEIKLALLVPKEKDPQTKLLQMLKEGDLVEITGRVFACPLDEPWLDVARLKKIASNAKKGVPGEEKSSDDKDSADENKDE